MFLVDTSVWLDFLRRRKTQEASWLRTILDHDIPFGVTVDIYREVLQGADSERSFERLSRFFRTQNFYAPEDPEHGAARAARLFCLARRAGLEIARDSACQIAQVAVERELLLLQADRSFELLQTVETRLKLYRGSLSSSALPSRIQEPGGRAYDPHGS
ncbi:MAG: PIN domain nuclease [Acidobacteriota bacterium]